jgi:hypothetical protein
MPRKLLTQGLDHRLVAQACGTLCDTFLPASHTAEALRCFHKAMTEMGQLP